jgi:hypothetical protein
MPIIFDVEVEKIQKEKDSAVDFQKRKHDAWNTNYTLGRDTVILNRLTQRQSVNIPLMKYAMQSVLKDIDEPPMLFFENLDNDIQKEILYNEGWNNCAFRNKLKIRDRIDKKQIVYYGRSWKKLNVVDGHFKFEIVDPQQMLVERHVDPADIDSARVLIQTQIFETLNNIVKNKDYDASGKAELQEYYAKDSTTQEQEDNFDRFQDKQKKMSDMGLTDAYDPLVGETYIELNEVYMKEYDTDLEENVIQMYVVAVTGEGMIKLFKKELEDVIGETKTIPNYWRSHFPYTSPSADPEATDFYNDAPADSIRQINIVANSWYSQEVENRTLKNFNMHYYDSTDAQFVPQTFAPVAWGWYPTPGDPNKVVKDVLPGDLTNNLEAIQFLIGIGEKAVAVSGSSTGQVEPRKVTLGEVEIAVNNAKERTGVIADLCKEDWLSFGEKYSMMIEATADKLDTITVYKKGRTGKRIYKKEIAPKQYMAKSGYRCTVRMKSDKDVEDATILERLAGVRSLMPNNTSLVNIQKEHALAFAHLDSDEIKKVMDEEKVAEVEVKTEKVIPNGVDNMGTTPVDNIPAVPAVVPQNIPAGGIK